MTLVFWHKTPFTSVLLSKSFMSGKGSFTGTNLEEQSYLQPSLRSPYSTCSLSPLIHSWHQCGRGRGTTENVRHVWCFHKFSWILVLTSDLRRSKALLQQRSLAIIIRHYEKWATWSHSWASQLPAERQNQHTAHWNPSNSRAHGRFPSFPHSIQAMSQ